MALAIHHYADRDGVIGIGQLPAGHRSRGRSLAEDPRERIPLTSLEDHLLRVNLRRVARVSG